MFSPVPCGGSPAKTTGFCELFFTLYFANSAMQIFYFTCKFYTYNLVGKVKHKGPLLRTTMEKIKITIGIQIVCFRQGFFLIKDRQFFIDGKPKKTYLRPITVFA